MALLLSVGTGVAGSHDMSHSLACYRCGAALDKLTLPLSQRDACPACSVHLHVCRMCEHFAPEVPTACREDDAEEVIDKEKMNFCEWFRPSPDAFDPQRARQAAQATAELGALFGDGAAPEADADDARSEAEKLFK